MIQVSVLMEEKSSLQVELQSLRERLNHSETPDVSSTITNKKLLLLQSQMEQLQEENDRCEAPRAAPPRGPVSRLLFCRAELRLECSGLYS